MSGTLSAPRTAEALRRSLSSLGIAMARRDPAAIRARLESLLRQVLEAPDPASAQISVEETILQTLLFLGFPAALTALATWRTLCDAQGAMQTPPEAADAPHDAGEAVCQAVYGSAYEKLRARMEQVHPAVNRWMLEDGYGKVMGRDGLDLGTRELLNVSVLAATDYPDQLHSHLRGALRVGVDAAMIEAALEEAIATHPEVRREALRTLWRKVQTQANRDAGD